MSFDHPHGTVDQTGIVIVHSDGRQDRQDSEWRGLVQRPCSIDRKRVKEGTTWPTAQCSEGRAPQEPTINRSFLHFSLLLIYLRRAFSELRIPRLQLSEGLWLIVRENHINRTGVSFRPQCSGNRPGGPLLETMANLPNPRRPNLSA